jgi:hypothetical protein
LSTTRVLVIIPTHDRKEFYHEAIGSVARQTRQADELVVIGNVGPGIRTEASLAERLNATIENSDCDAFLILADDDRLDEHYIEETVSVMERESVDVVYTDCEIFGDRSGRGNALGEWNEFNINLNTVPLCTSLCRKSAWKAAGGYVDAVFYDWDFWWRCFYSGATAFWLKEPLFWWRDHAESATRTEDLKAARKQTIERQHALKAAMARREK